MILSPSIDTFEKSKQLLADGELVAFPTETVYGLGANAMDPQAIQKIFETKNRPQTNPIIVHVGAISQILDYAHISNPIEQKIIDKLMPGPLTILLRKKPSISDIVTAGSEFVGIRIPANQVALELLKLVNLPIAAPSANLSTKPSPTSAQMVYDNFAEKVKIIIDGGSCAVGIESTVVKVEPDHILITRPGYITKEDLEDLFGGKVLVKYASKISEITPGNMFKHYSPSANISIFHKFSPDLINSFPNQKISIIATQEWIGAHYLDLQQLDDSIQILVWGSQSNLVTCAQNLFNFYHQCDIDHVDQILVEGLDEVGFGYAIMNRVKKSAQNNI